VEKVVTPQTKEDWRQALVVAQKAPTTGMTVMFSATAIALDEERRRLHNALRASRLHVRAAFCGTNDRKLRDLLDEIERLLREEI
jgi:hypothetical protein